MTSASANPLRAELLERHAALLEAVCDPVLVVAPDGTILYTNREAAGLLGYAPGSLDGRPVNDLLPPERRDHHGQVMEAFFRAPTRRPMGEGRALAARTADGTPLRVEISLSPFTMDAGMVCLALVKDITRQTEVEEALRLRSAALEAAANGICITTRDGDILWANPAFTALTGYPREEVIGANPRFLKSGRQPDAVYQDLWQTILSGRVWQGELINRRRDGSEYIEDQTITPVRDRHGAVTHFIAVKTDVTQRREADFEVRRAADALRRRTEELARSNRDLAQFAYAASHDLQEPLRMVSGFLQLLDKRHRAHLNEEAREFIAFAVDGAARMKQLIDGLLEFSRVRTRGKAPTAVELNDVLKTTLALLTAAIQESRAQVHCADLPCVQGDPAQLIQLFQNLIGNALKFRGDQPPRITVSAAPLPDGWQISVADNGIGIEPQHRERIFEIFQRLHDRGRYEGTGMGLALCKRIVERHQGRIWVESETGQGATFRFTLRSFATDGEPAKP